MTNRTMTGVAVLLAVTGLTGSGAAAQGRPVTPAAQLSGSLRAVGGPGRTPGRPLTGVITVRDWTKPATTITTRSDGTFTARLPPGVYRITGRSPAYQGGQRDCTTLTATVVVSSTAPQNVLVFCSER